MEIEKATKSNNPYENMIVSGVASTNEKDWQNEVLPPNKFDVSYLMESGFLNWDHQVKNTPSAIIGEPIKAEVKDNKLFVKGKLYSESKLAREVYDLGLTLEKSNANRKLGWSIEGSRHFDENGILLKAKINNVAITHNPVNTSTFVDIVKALSGNVEANKKISKDFEKWDEEVLQNSEKSFSFEDDEKIIEIKGTNIKFINKALTAGNVRGSSISASGGAVLKKESMLSIHNEEYKNLLGRIINLYPDITLVKAMKVVKNILKN